MRIRTIKPEFFEDERLASLSAHDRLLFIGLWCLADKNGVLEDRPAWIKAKCFPYEHGEATDASQMLHRLVSGGYIIRYTANVQNVQNSRDFIYIRNFSKHQRINGKEAEGEGRYPLPDKDLIEGKQSGSSREATGKHPGAREQGTGNREQGTGSDMGNASKSSTRTQEPTPTPTPESHPDLFSWLEGCDLYAESEHFLRNVIPALRNFDEAHPDVNHRQELLKSHAWLIANPGKPKKNLLRFYMNWLNRAVSGFNQEKSHGR